MKSSQEHAYAYVVRPDETASGVVYLAQHPDLPGCMAHGATPAEAIANLTEAREMYLADLVRRGLALPESRGMVFPTRSAGASEAAMTGGWGVSEPAPVQAMAQVRTIGEEPLTTA